MYSVYGGNYSSTMTSQETTGTPIEYPYGGNAMMVELDLDASDYIIYSGGEGMTEIKEPTKDIHVKIKTR